MASVRVFLCTYRRNELLRRAVSSLIAQTFTDWVCELHNDDPADPFPGRLVNDLGDPRITAYTHSVNLGPTRTFNLMYQGNPRERYVSLLEDDNWWEAGFLERLTREMDARPDIQVGWANMRVWQEQRDGSWIDTGRQAAGMAGSDGIPSAPFPLARSKAVAWRTPFTRSDVASRRCQGRSAGPG